MKLDIRLIAPGPGAGTILLEDGARLPVATIDIEADGAAIRVVRTWLDAVMDLRVPVLETYPKWVGLTDDEPIPPLVLTEPALPDWRPPTGLTFGPIPADPGDIPASLRPRSSELLDELRTGTPPPDLRPRWARRGWFDRASGWMRAAAAETGRPLTGDPAPFYLRGISALLRAPTDGPNLFLKAVFPPFHAEPVLTRLLAARFPAVVPTVVAVEPDEGWLIVEDVGSAWVGEVPAADRPEGLRRGAAALVEIQRELAGDVAAIRTLLDAGAPHRPLATLVRSVADADGPDGFGVVDGGLERERAQRVVDAVAESVTKVEALGLPRTVVHGDFHSGNVALVDDRIVIIDWSDAAIGNPAIDLVTWIAWSGDKRSEIDAAIAGWVDAWSIVVDATALRAAIDEVLIVGAAYQIVSYDGIRRNLEPATRYTMTGGGDHFLTTLERVAGIS